jgi:hypothetical protein
LDGYKRPLVGSLSANLQRFGMEKVGKLESLQEIIAEMTDTAGTSEKTSPGYSGQTTRMTDKQQLRWIPFDIGEITTVPVSVSRGGATVASLCHNDRMAKKQTKRTMLRSTDWNVGQPLAFPQLHAGIKSLARDAVDEAMSGPFSPKRQKHKKK